MFLNVGPLSGVQNLRARTGISKVKKSLDQRMAAMREARKIALMQKRYGQDWITEMNSDQAQSGADLKEMFDLCALANHRTCSALSVMHAFFCVRMLLAIEKQASEPHSFLRQHGQATRTGACTDNPT